MNLFLRTALSCSFIMAAQPAFAVEHEVWVEYKGFFPKIIHVSEGDTIRFINKSYWPLLIKTSDPNDNYSGYDSSDPCDNSSSYAGSTDDWITSQFSPGNSIVVEVTACMETSFRGPYYYGGYDSYSGPGSISFAPPVLGF